jgi:hypothetical protein
MAESTLARPSYLSKYFLYCVFSDIPSHRIAFLLHQGLLTMSFPSWKLLLLKTYAFPPDTKKFRHMMELTVVSHRLFLGESNLDPLPPERKHSGEPLRPGHGFFSESWA